MRALILAALLTLAGGTGLAAQPESASPSSGEQVVQALVNAINRHDLDAATALYAPGAQYFTHPSDLYWEDLAQMREEFQVLFDAEPQARMEVVNRITHGDYVIQLERYVTGEGEPIFTVTIVYHVVAGAIQNAWIVHTE